MWGIALGGLIAGGVAGVALFIELRLTARAARRSDAASCGTQMISAAIMFTHTARLATTSRLRVGPTTTIMMAASHHLASVIAHGERLRLIGRKGLADCTDELLTIALKVSDMLMKNRAVDEHTLGALTDAVDRLRDEIRRTR